MKRLAALFAAISVILCACALPSETENSGSSVFPYTFTDSVGNSVTVSSIERVVILYGSFADAWLSAGGTLAGTTDDAVSERNLPLGENTEIIGSVKHPSLEKIVALSPTFVILSADIASHASCRDALAGMGIPAAMFRIDSFDDYLSFLKLACDMTGRSDLYVKNGLAVKEHIEALLAEYTRRDAPSVLLLRAYSSGVKAKTDDNFAGVMLDQFGCVNIAEKYTSLLEELSLELVLREDPDYIFVLTMGDEEKVKQNFIDTVNSNPAWQSLTAVKNGKLIFLPKELFHYKPNARWGESYDYLKALLFSGAGAEETGQ